MYDENEVRVIYKGKLVLSVGRDAVNTAHAALNLQMPRTHTTPKARHIAAASVYTLPYKQQQLKYMHQNVFQHAYPNTDQRDREQVTQGVPVHDSETRKKSPRTITCDAKRSYEATADRHQKHNQKEG